MGRPSIDMTNQQFGRLTVLSKLDEVRKKAAYWICLCGCGNKTIAAAHHLRQGKKLSCGCLSDHIAPFSGEKNKTHGMDGSATYRTYYSMLARCKENAVPSKRKNYWDRGISVCDRWKESFENFLSDMGERPDGQMSIDRIDNDKGYEPGNCRWVHISDQSKNRRVCIFIEKDGVTRSLDDWAGIVGINRATLYSRIRDFGWDPVKAISTPPARRGDRYKAVEYRGEVRSLMQWAKVLGIPYSTLHSRLERGLPMAP